MDTKRSLLDSDVPLVAVSFSDDDSVLARDAQAAGVDVAELRIDQFSSTDVAHVLKQVRAFEGLSTLATIRSAHEGGGWRGAEEERLTLFRAVAPLVDAVDIELSSREIIGKVIAAARQHGAVVIVSYHNFECTPGTDELEAIINDAKNVGADLVKVSTMATSSNDVKRLASLLLNTEDDSKLIVIAMGATGTVSRVFFPALGSRLTYSFFGASTAPGQLDYPETFRLLRKFYPAYHQRKRLAMENPADE